MNFAEVLSSAAAEYGINLSEEQLQAFVVYNKLLLEWNEKVNLTAITDPREVAVKHMIDSLSCYDEQLFPKDCQVIDVGSGAGFPGLPLKIYRPDIQLTLLDSLNKRLVFLNDVIENLQMTGVILVHARAEEAGQKITYRQRYQVVLSRAVARLNVLAELCLPFAQWGGCFIALKGAQFKEEVSEASRAIDMLGGKITNIKAVKLPWFDDQRAVIYISKCAATPASFPRRPGMPEKKPL